jgi:hypothetical protein
LFFLHGLLQVLLGIHGQRGRNGLS